MYYFSILRQNPYPPLRTVWLCPSLNVLFSIKTQPASPRVMAVLSANEKHRGPGGINLTEV